MFLLNWYIKNPTIPTIRSKKLCLLIFAIDFVPVCLLNCQHTELPEIKLEKVSFIILLFHLVIIKKFFVCLVPQIVDLL